MHLSVSTEDQLRRETSAWVNTPEMMAFPRGPTHAVLVLTASGSPENNA